MTASDHLIVAGGVAVSIGGFIYLSLLALGLV